MITDKMIERAWNRLADALWKQSTIAYEEQQHVLSSAWAKASIHAAGIGQYLRRKQRGFREFKRI